MLLPTVLNVSGCRITITARRALTYMIKQVIHVRACTCWFDYFQHTSRSSHHFLRSCVQMSCHSNLRFRQHSFMSTPNTFYKKKKKGKRKKLSFPDLISRIRRCIEMQSPPLLVSNWPVTLAGPSFMSPLVPSS